MVESLEGCESRQSLSGDFLARTALGYLSTALFMFLGSRWREMDVEAYLVRPAG